MRLILIVSMILVSFILAEARPPLDGHNVLQEVVELSAGEIRELKHMESTKGGVPYIRLKALLKEKGVNVSRRQLQEVRLYMKSKFTNHIRLKLNQQNAAVTQVAESAWKDYESHLPSTFSWITLTNRNLDSLGSWQIVLSDANIDVMFIEVELLTYKTTTVYKMWNGHNDNMLGGLPGEAGYSTENKIELFDQGNLGDGSFVALYRCKSWPNNHFTSLAENCEGQQVEGRLGYLARRKTPTANVPIYRCFNSQMGNHSISNNECRDIQGYVNEGLLGYAISWERY